MNKNSGLFASEHWEIVLNKVGIEFRSRFLSAGCKPRPFKTGSQP